jgi:hypothetical protein
MVRGGSRQSWLTDLGLHALKSAWQRLAIPWVFWAAHSLEYLAALALRGHFEIRRPEAPPAVWALNGRDEVGP